MIKYLALGDSYTIGESLPLAENFPNQLVKILQETNFEIYLDKIIAITGWTTDELAQAIYRMVGLLQGALPVTKVVVTL